jgi:hypothetical protein
LTPTSLAAVLATAGFLLLAGFQAALAAGVPWGRAAWGGRQAVLPRNLRIASVVSMIIWLGAGAIILARAGLAMTQIPDAIAYWGTWVLVALLLVGAVVNFASSSPYERFGWAPFALVMALLTLVVALS